MIAELEVFEDVLNIVRKTVKIVFEISKQLLPAAAGLQVPQRKARGIVKGLPRSGLKRSALFRDTRIIEHLFRIEHRLLSGLQDCIHTPDNAHRKDNIRVFTPLKEIAQYIICDPPNKGDNLVVSGLIHFTFYPFQTYPGSCLILVQAIIVKRDCDS